MLLSADKLLLTQHGSPAVQGESALQALVLKSQLTNCLSQQGNLDDFCRVLLAGKAAGSQALAQLPCCLS